MKYEEHGKFHIVRKWEIDYYSFQEKKSNSAYLCTIYMTEISHYTAWILTTKAGIQNFGKNKSLGGEKKRCL